MPVKKEEMFSSYSHLFGLIISIIGLFFLMNITRGHADFTAVSLVYILSASFLYFSSSVYHGRKKEEGEVTFWRKMDHIAIFFMIAGSYTPVCYIYLDGFWKWGIIILQWTLVLLGLFFKLFYLQAPRFLNTGIYLVMGWIAIVLLKVLFETMPGELFFMLVSGGLAYTAGAVIYAIKKPEIFPGIFGFHEIFHIFILLGSGFHFMMIYKSLEIAAAG
jgi:hemolysin III